MKIIHGEDNEKIKKGSHFSCRIYIFFLACGGIGLVFFIWDENKTIQECIDEGNTPEYCDEMHSW